MTIWQSEKEDLTDGFWRHREIRLQPDSTAAGFEPIILCGVREDEVRVVGELVEVLGATGR